MRLRLAFNFTYLVLILYAIGAVASVGVFKAGLDRSMDSLLLDLLTEIRPAVQLNAAGEPTLREWASAARTENLPIVATIQLFDENQIALETYGPEGLTTLVKGRRSLLDRKIAVRSDFQKILHSRNVSGYLQVQVSTEADDRAIDQLILAMVIATPILAIFVAAAGYVFAGLALQPVERTMELLRRFVADAGHELKTPISVIDASLETIEDVHRTAHLAHTETEMIRAASARMKSLTQDLMFLAKVEDPMLAFKRKDVDLVHLLEDVLQEYSPLAEAKKIKVDFSSMEQLTVHAEPESFRQLVSNLVSNAISYNRSGGSVEVSVTRQGDAAFIRVSDTGLGIADDVVPHIFDRFYRGEKSRSRSAGGAGLGLSIVKAVADRHGATVSVQSTIGSGTTFTVGLPVYGNY